MKIERTQSYFVRDVFAALDSPASDLKAPNTGEDDVVSFFIFLSSRTKNGPQWLSVENSGGYKKGMFISMFLPWTLVSAV